VFLAFRALLPSAAVASAAGPGYFLALMGRASLSFAGVGFASLLLRGREPSFCLVEVGQVVVEGGICESGVVFSPVFLVVAVVLGLLLVGRVLGFVLFLLLVEGFVYFLQRVGVQRHKEISFYLVQLLQDLEHLLVVFPGLVLCVT